MTLRPELRRLLAGAALAVTAAAASPAAAENTLAWTDARTSVGTCVVNQTCGQPGGLRVLRREALTQTDVDFNNASVYPDDYAGQTPFNFGTAYASAQAGEGAFSLPVLKAFASGGFVVTPPGAPPTIGVSVASVQAIQGYRNTGETALAIPLKAFQGMVDFFASGNPVGGRVGATLAVTTSAIEDPFVAAEYAGTAGWTGGCGSTGALAYGSNAVNPANLPNTKQYLGVSTTTCGADTYLLNPGDSFYVWATLQVSRGGPGVTNAANTFNVTIAPEYVQQVTNELSPQVAQVRGANIAVPVGVVPEPSTWALMIGGFGLAGAALRGRRRIAT